MSVFLVSRNPPCPRPCPCSCLRLRSALVLSQHCFFSHSPSQRAASTVLRGFLAVSHLRIAKSRASQVLSCLVPAAVVFRLVFCNRIRCASSSSYSHTGYGILRCPSSPGSFPRVHVLVSSAIVPCTIGYKIVKSTLRRSALSQEYFGLLECTPMRPGVSYGLVFSFRLVHVLTAVCNNASFSFNFVSSSSVSTMVIRVLNHNPRRKLAGARS